MLVFRAEVSMLPELLRFQGLDFSILKVANAAGFDIVLMARKHK